ncbi:MAG: hypothetical protein JXN59_17280, partial [Anaerolineae bacterium]|nr:hypothetical protein [Anaerolineae bacterium]
KAFLLARDAARVNVILVSDMAPEKVRQMQLTPASDLQQAVDAALAGLPPDAHLAVAPVANAIVPQVRT